MLGDLGAEVIKIESPTRLAARIGQFAGNQGFERYWDRCSYFLEMNRSKYGLSIDLSTSRGRDIFLRLVEEADVVVENNTPRVMRNLDLEYPVLKAVNPAIIMLSISGFGQTGPGRDYSAFGSNIEAACGIASLTGYAGDDQPYNTTNYYADPIATVHAPVALLAALEYRDATGRGQYIDMALNEGGIVFCSEAFMEYGLTGRVPERRGNRHPRFAPQGCYPSMGNDAWMVLTVRSDEEWRRLREVVGDPRLDDPRFDTEAGRRAGHDEIDEALAAWSAGLDHYEAARRLQAAGVPAGPVLANWEMISDLHAHERGFYVMLPTRRVGAWVHSGMPWHFSRTPGVIRRDSPAYGEHNRLVLERLLGMRPEEIDGLYRDRVVTEDPPERYLQGLSAALALLDGALGALLEAPRHPEPLHGQLRPAQGLIAAHVLVTVEVGERQADACGAHRGDGPRHLQRAVHDLAAGVRRRGEADALGLGGAHDLAGQHDLLRLRRPHEPRPARARAPTPESRAEVLQMPIADLRRLAHQAEVARQRELDPARAAHPVDDGDGRLEHVVDVVGELIANAPRRSQALGGGLEVGPRREAGPAVGARRPRQQPDADGVVRLDLRHRRRPALRG